MPKHIIKHIAPLRLRALPEEMRRELKQARLKRGWSQAELGRRLGLPQMHVSRIESGKIVPRFDTLLDFVRVLDHDLLLVPRSLVPALQALIRDHRRHPTLQDDERPLYADDGEQEAERGRAATEGEAKDDAVAQSARQKEKGKRQK
ncbi:MAG: helix-turn-helix transcriptional regulator [Candidatus Acidiferrales bacterium]